MQPAKRVILNTGIIYSNLLIRLFVGLITTRLILNALGETDYGIYALVGGVIGLLSFLGTSMSIASMRFLAHSLGTGDMETIKTTFNTSLIIHFILGVIVVLFLEAGGLLMFEYWLNIPEDKIFDAKIIFHFMVFTMFITVISVPFDAVMNAHENFLAITLINSTGIIVNLGIAIYLTYLNSNLLIIYGFLVLLNQILLRVLKQWYSSYNYQECKVRLREYIDKKLMKSMLSFVGWNILSVSGGIIIVQSKSILLNMFFGVNLNAANGIATALTERLNSISVSMTQALDPQIMKNEGGGERSRMIYLTVTSAKFSVFLLSIFSIPVLIETPYLLELWLKNVPDYAVIFTRLIIISMIMEKFTFPITTAINAVGKIKEATIVGFLIISMTIPISYWLYSIGQPPETIFVVGIFIYLCLAIYRLYYGKKLVGINIAEYLRIVVIKPIFPLTLASIITIIPYFIFEEGFMRLTLTSLVCLVSSIILIRYFGLSKMEYIKLKQITISVLSKLKKIFLKRIIKLRQ